MALSSEIFSFMNKFAGPLIVLLCAMILTTLKAYQSYVLDGEGPRMRLSLSQVSLQHHSSKPFSMWMLAEDFMLLALVLFALKPFAELCWELMDKVQWSVKELLQMGDEKDCERMPVQDSCVEKGQGTMREYGACAGANAKDSVLTKKLVQPSYAASHVQEPMLTWQSMNPKGAALNEGWCIWLQGDAISIEFLRDACRCIVERHEALRLKFSFGDGQNETWAQQVVPTGNAFADIFSQADALNDERCALQLAEEAFNKPFAIFGGFCARIGLVRVSSSKVLFYIVQHHVGTDAVSMPLLYEDLKTQYNLAVSGVQKELSIVTSPLPRGCDAFAKEQLTMATEGHVNEALQWWREHLRGGTKLDLPTDGVPKPQPSFNCVHVPILISPELSGKIQALSQSEGVTVFEVCLALHFCWLSLMSRQDDLVTLISHHGRTGKNADDVVGCFRPLLPLRLALQGSFRDVLQAAAQAKKGVLGHSGVPTMQLFELAGIDSHRGQSNLNYYSDRYNKAGISSAAAKAPFTDGVQASLVEFPKRSVIFDVELNLSKDATGCLCGHANFSADLFSSATAERMAEHFCTVAAAAVADTACNVWELPLLTPHAEEALDGFHGSLVEFQPTVVEMLNQCIQKSFGKVAVEYEPTGEQLTYGEFGARVCGLAAHLTQLGIGPDMLCALMLERSLEMVVGINAVWWAGGAYVPMEPKAPDKYLDFITEDMKSHNGALDTNRSDPVSLTVLTQSWTLERRNLQEYFSHAVSLDTFQPRLPCPDQKPAQGFPLGSHLAYSIYTSGSTGRPKGVLVQHLGLANYLSQCSQTHSVVGQDVIMQKTPYIFDVSLAEFGLPLTVAAKLLVAKDEAHKDLTYMVDAIRRCGVTYARFVPSYLDVFLDHVKMAGDSAGANVDMPLRVVGVSGEALHAPTCWNFLKLLPKTEISDLYGPTEATVEVTQLAVTGKALRSGKTIGQPLGGCQLYVATFSERESGGLHCARTPVGLHGELLLGGVQVARGYLNLPEQTSKAFIQNPFLQDASNIVYRTGDVVKWRADGHLVYIGRADNQVKLSGQRIELGEIQSAVSSVPGVREAVVKMVQDENGSSQLVAYVAPASVAAEGITQRCREVLPQHMVPSVVVGIDEWPRTSSGKIDQKKLPVPSVAAYGEEAPDQADSLALLAEKIQSLGFVGALSDDEVRQYGWNSFQLMNFHAEIMRNPENFSKSESAPVEAQKGGTPHQAELDCEMAKVSMGITSIVGHLWCLLMTLVLLEWLVAYWEWYRAVPAAAGFQLTEFPVLEELNSLGRLLGDPIFIMLCSIQDMTDVRAGNTGQLIRRAILFMGIAVVFTLLNKWLLQGPYLRHGWIDESWGSDTGRVCGVLNGAIFIFARAAFMVVPILLSIGRCSWIRFCSIEWPWVCLACSLLLPAVAAGLEWESGFKDESGFTVTSYAKSTKSFIVELCPYYFLYPLFVGGITFPRGHATLKARCSTWQCYAVTIAATILWLMMYEHMGIKNTQAVDAIQMDHVRWGVFLQQFKFKPSSEWPLLSLVAKNCDVYAAINVGILTMLLAAMVPSTPTPFSFMGTRVIGAYLTMPLTLCAAGHFIAPHFLHITGSWRPVLVPIGVISTLLLIMSATCAQNVLPERLVKWASASNGGAQAKK